MILSFPFAGLTKYMANPDLLLPPPEANEASTYTFKIREPYCINAGSNGKLIFIHLQRWEVLPFWTIQHQRCIKILCPKDPEFLLTNILLTH